MGTLGMRIKAARVRRGLSVQQVAEHCNLTAKTVRFWEDDASKPDHFFLIAVARLCEIDVALLREGGAKWDEAIVNLSRRRPKTAVVDQAAPPPPSPTKKEYEPDPFMKALLRGLEIERRRAK